MATNQCPRCHSVNLFAAHECAACGASLTPQASQTKNNVASAAIGAVLAAGLAIGSIYLVRSQAASEIEEEPPVAIKRSPQPTVRPVARRAPAQEVVAVSEPEQAQQAIRVNPTYTNSPRFRLEREARERRKIEAARTRRDAQAEAEEETGRQMQAETAARLEAPRAKTVYEFNRPSSQSNEMAQTARGILISFGRRIQNASGGELDEIEADLISANWDIEAASSEENRAGNYRNLRLSTDLRLGIANLRTAIRMKKLGDIRMSNYYVATVTGDRAGLNYGRQFGQRVMRDSLRMGHEDAMRNR